MKPVIAGRPVVKRLYSACVYAIAICCLAGGCGGCSTTPPGGGSPDAARNKGVNASRVEPEAEPPLTAETHFAAGWLAENQGDPRLAVRQYREALKLQPRHEASLYRLGVVSTQLKDKDAAVGAWKQYLQATNDSASGYANLGFCYEMFGEGELAEQAFKTGIAREPGNRACRVNYGLMLARRGRLREASEQLGSVLTPAQVHYNLGSVFEQQGEAERARGEYEKALALDARLQDAKTRLEQLRPAKGGSAAE